jgi:mono/diheme cytochrome c family protein
MKFIWLLLLLTLSLPGAERFHALLNKYCVECHGGRKTKGGVNFKKYSGPEHIYKNFETWEDVIHQIGEGEMPPEDEPQMSKQDKDFFLGTLKAIFKKAQTVDLGDPGPTPLRRLTRNEYNNSIRDIFGPDLHLGKEFPSEGGGGEGFDNNAEVLTLSPIMFEKYVAEAGKLSEHLVFNYTMGFEIKKEKVPLRNTPQQEVYLRRIEDEFKALALPKQLRVENYLEKFMIAARKYMLSGNKGSGSLKSFAKSNKINGILLGHIVDYLTNRKKQNHIEKKYLKQWYELKKNSPKTLVDKAAKEFKKGYEKGRYINQSKTAEPKKPYRDLFSKVKKAFTINDKELQESLSDKNRATFLNTRKERNLIKHDYKEDRKQFLAKAFTKLSKAQKRTAYAKPSVSLNKKDQAKYKWLSDQLNKNFQEKQSLLKPHIEALLTKAWRKTPSKLEVDRMLQLFNKINAVKGDQYAARAVVIRTFCSPLFIFRVEKQLKTNKPFKISDSELAVRLSYFLWSTKPDAELIALAAKNQLSAKGVLDKQVDRMLKDPRARALGVDFAAQWLKFRDVLETVEVDKKKFPQLNEKLTHDMYEECVSTFNDIVQSDSSVLNLIDSKYVFLNENLAKIYGVKNVKGSHFRKVALKDRDRGGLVTSPAMMTMTSYPLRTSPVLRGNYIISTLLGTPTPPPPDNVAELPKDDDVKDGLTVKQRLEKHRGNSQCASCHNRLDPIGFPLEVFDPIGRKRTRIAGQLIDATGDLKDGRKIKGPIGLKKYLLKKEHLFLENMATKLLGYSLGRGVQFFDKYIIAQTVKACKDSKYKFSAMIKTIVNSKTFQYRRSSQL